MPGPRFPELERWMRTRELRGCVPRTLVAYRRIVTRALRFQEVRGRPTDPTRWELADALAFKKLFRGSHWSLTVLAEFARHFGNDVVRDAGIPPQPNATHVRWLSRDEVDSVVSGTGEDPLLAFVAFLGLGQGLRRVEWQRMRTEDVDLVGRRLLVRGKGRSQPKLLWVPLHPAFDPIYRRLLAYRADLLTEARRRCIGAVDPPELIVHRTAEGLGPYSVSGLDLLVHRIGARLQAKGVDVRLSSHMFRRSGATLLEEALLKSPGQSPDGIYRVIQGFLRHENLATTMKYLESNPGRQARALATFAAAVPWPLPSRGELGGAPLSAGADRAPAGVVPSEGTTLSRADRPPPRKRKMPRAGHGPEGRDSREPTRGR
jgi:integrase